MSGGRNCYPESDVLVNKYNIRDKELLEKSKMYRKIYEIRCGTGIKEAK